MLIVSVLILSAHIILHPYLRSYTLNKLNKAVIITYFSFGCTSACQESLNLGTVFLEVVVIHILNAINEKHRRLVEVMSERHLRLVETSEGGGT